ncbi:rhomboid family intramembrane serine protease [Candidatus Micrarchaeota archaeon]|nr:rhomboid family intramembrane serine protease [Candidatus Micrarchaeota archaeon]
MRIPWATLVLTVAVLAVYFFSSSGNLYPDSSLVGQHAYGASNPLALIFSLFFHIGARHLVSNLLPLVAFCFLLEMSLPSRHAFLVFFASGILSAFVFSILNPSSFLVGASAGVAGLMTAGALLRPKWGVLVLIAVPFVLGVVALPLVDWAASASFSALGVKTSELRVEADRLQAAGQTQAAASVRAQAEAINATLAQQESVRAQEAVATPDEIVHLVGALAGVLYVLVFFRDKMRDGFEELFAWFSALLPRRVNGSS